MKQITIPYISMIIFTILAIVASVLGIADKIDNFNIILMIALGVVAFILSYMIAHTAKLLSYLFVPFSAIIGAIIGFIALGGIQVLFIGVGLGASFVGFLISKIINQ